MLLLADSCASSRGPLSRIHHPPTTLHATPLQLDVVKRDCARLANENGALHRQLIEAAERAEAARREAAAERQRLEARAAELEFWKAQAAAR